MSRELHKKILFPWIFGAWRLKGQHWRSLVWRDFIIYIHYNEEGGGGGGGGGGQKEISTIGRSVRRMKERLKL